MHFSTIVLYCNYKLNKPYRRKFKMKKIQKSKKGFTLVEMVLVIAYLNKAKAASSSIQAHNSSISIVNSEINAAM